MNALALALLLAPARPAVVKESLTTWTLSVYSTRYHGRTAANGKRYDHHALTVAANTFPLGTRLVIEHGGRRVVVTVTDRLDRKLGRTRIDLSGAAMRALEPHYDLTDRTGGLLRGALVWTIHEP